MFYNVKQNERGLKINFFRSRFERDNEGTVRTGRVKFDR